MRTATRVERAIADWDEQAWLSFRGQRLNVRRLRGYFRALRPFAQVWEEAMLMATIDFVRGELGLSNVYMHDWESGNRIKAITARPPPKRLYTALPRRFCFERSQEGPAFITRERRFRRRMRHDRKPLLWHRLAA